MAQNGYAERLLAIVDAQHRLAATGERRELINLAAELALAQTTADAVTLALAGADGAAVAGERAARDPEAMAAEISVVVARGEVTLGTLTAHAIAPEAFSETDVHTLELIAGMVAAQLAHLEAVAPQVRRDPLTGLANRRAYEEQLIAECSRARRHEQPLTLCLLDLDEFALFNDRRGREAGDEVLREVARILSRLRAEDAPFRIGGDEFAIILPGTSAARASVAVGRLVEEIAARIEGGVSASFGLADSPLNPQELHEAAASRLAGANGRRILREAARV